MKGILVKPRAWLGVLALAAGAASAADGFDIAITVDDLSVHGPLVQGTNWVGVAQSYLDTLKAHAVPEAYGFVNARRIDEQPASAPVLDAWRAAGYPLGNHTYSHMNINQAPTLQAWLDDVKSGEAAIASRMQGADWRYLRFPFLAAGNDPARHDGAAAWLKERGYRIADVSVSFNDWAYTDVYARCMTKGDNTAIAAMKAQYLKGVDDAIVRMQTLSQRVYGRMIPQVLLTHMGAWSALTLPEVMAKLDAAGARYVPLSRAQSDAVYRESGRKAGEGMLMERTAFEKSIGIGDIPGPAPFANLDAMCR
jgi:peptidoglycan/xylan/chitin deacetylase (PgdA/CDA1 family)